MSALTPDCDPDLSGCGSVTDRPGPGIRSTLVLLGALVASVLVATGDAVPMVLSVVAGGVALLSTWALARRVVRLARRAAPAVAAHGASVAAVRRSRPAA
ncbi:hypothetical protein [Geodermatophilus sabuli]|uniref:Uncharacterized protein n=1 Tax=Geodermatophilus sabuli TaxID=1564158 RepID=A0A285EAU1_9ACTN|nr:hypothetical protein [Geodermatophilus sabuli]MBB3085607.1 hypothetical protein [Geodermatophilus sabuli]SNX95973.1 hypothetical protein SAMN06893097_103142 [Geodermatophilus sabuli]